MNKLTTQEFIDKAKLVHGDRYDYSLTNYDTSRKKVKIICLIHGVFEQKANSHLNNHGCPDCNNTGGLNKHTTQEFINKAKLVHGDKYDYSLVDYKNNRIKVKIICPIHGVFEQSPLSHVVGKTGCSKCSMVYNYTTQEFINKAKLVHGDKYDYSLVDYKTGKIKVKIICPIHGVFEQTASSHLNGESGCPVCQESKGEREIAKYLDNFGIKYIREYKFQDCKNIFQLPFDFYLLDYNLCIEYDGIQHYKSIDFFGGENGLLESQKRDNIKTKYCRENNIKLLRISYKDNIEDSLKKLFDNIQK